MSFLNKHVAKADSRATQELRLVSKPGFAPRVTKGGQRLDPKDSP